MEAVIGVLTVSDSRAAGISEDLSGPAVVEALQGFGYALFAKEIVPDEVEEIQDALLRLSQTCDAVFTTGGTGFSPRDVTPEATDGLLERRADNLSELIRMKGLEHTAFSHLSRGVCGIIGSSLVVNLPGSPKGARQGIEAIGFLLEPILTALRGDDCSAHN